MKGSEVFPSKYLKAEELDEDLTVTIRSVVLEKLESKDGGIQEKPVITFRETPKSLVCNKTNWAIISKCLGSDDSDDWIGKSITLTVLEVDAFGDVVQAIRVRPPRKTAPVVPGVKKGSEIEADGELITKYWMTVKAFGLDRKKGLQILQENGNDFEKATAFLENTP